MSEREQLEIHRRTLNTILDRKDAVAVIQEQWVTVNGLIDNWWKAYKAWEAKDTFNTAFKDKRMTVRTFPGGEGSFAKQVSKEFGSGSISVASYDKPTRQTVVRVFADSKYTPQSSSELSNHDRIFHKTDEKYKYRAVRGVDSSAFANPANFATRETKYEAGLHDLSASLLNPQLSIFDQVHNNEAGSHFSFVALSEEADQEVLYSLTRYAKALRATLFTFYTKVRGYRAEMTRVKLANEFDMGIVYTAVPVPLANRATDTSPAYKLRYGLGKMTTITGEGGQQSVPVTANLYKDRQESARKFKSILGIRDAKNEIVIAMRKHAGPFPVYAIRDGAMLKCYSIEGTEMKFNGKMIFSSGRMT